MIAPAVDRPAGRPPALDAPAVRGFIRRAHPGPEPVDHVRDAVALLDPELGRPAHRRAPAGDRLGDRQRRAARRSAPGSPPGSMSVAVSAAGRTTRSATGSLADRALVLAARSCAPMRRRTSSAPVRVGLTPTPRTTSSPSARDRRGDEPEERGREVARHVDARRARGTAGPVDRRGQRVGPRARRRRTRAACARCGRATARARAPSSSPRRRARRGARPTSPARSRPSSPHAARRRGRSPAPRTTSGGVPPAPVRRDVGAHRARAARRCAPSAVPTATRRRPAWPRRSAPRGARRAAACPCPSSPRSSGVRRRASRAGTALDRRPRLRPARARARRRRRVRRPRRSVAAAVGALVRPAHAASCRAATGGRADRRDA